MIQSIITALNNSKIISFFSGIAKNRLLDHYRKPINVDYVYVDPTDNKQKSDTCSIRITRIVDDTFTVTFNNGWHEQPDFIIIKFKESKIVKATKECKKEDNSFPYMDVLVAFVEKYSYLPKKRNKKMEEQIKKRKQYEALSIALKKQDEHSS